MTVRAEERFLRPKMVFFVFLTIGASDIVKYANCEIEISI